MALPVRGTGKGAHEGTGHPATRLPTHSCAHSVIHPGNRALGTGEERS